MLQRSLTVLLFNSCRKCIVPAAILHKNSNPYVGCAFFRMIRSQPQRTMSSPTLPLYSQSPRLPSRSVQKSHQMQPKFHQRRMLLFRYYASSSDEGNNKSNDSARMHQFYLQQMQELEAERESLFGEVGSKNTEDFGTDIPTAQRANDAMVVQEQSMHSTTPTPIDEEMKRDREGLFGFTSEEMTAWSQVRSSSSYSTSSSRNVRSHAEFLREIEIARKQQSESMTSSTRPDVSPQSTTTFTHLSSDGTNIQMVDVGSKALTRRTATAQSFVVFPPEVLHAFGAPEPLDVHSKTRENEWMGRKGPIFATAITAGIMGVKQTSALIPLCHPMPLENVSIDIVWSSKDSVRITCTCSVTHKTGVEMEALMGCSIAALTIYDMVKAVSHNVQITNTQLLYKDGGKRLVDQRAPQ